MSYAITQDSVFGPTHGGVPNPFVSVENSYPTRFHGASYVTPDQTRRTFRENPRDVPINLALGSGPDGLGASNMSYAVRQAAGVFGDLAELGAQAWSADESTYTDTSASQSLPGATAWMNKIPVAPVPKPVPVAPTPVPSKPSKPAPPVKKALTIFGFSPVLVAVVGAVAVGAAVLVTTKKKPAAASAVTPRRRRLGY